MPYHLQLRRGFRRAWSFNLTEAELAALLAPWRRSEAVRLGGHEWEPDKTGVIVLEGDELAPSDLSYGQGWNAAERHGEDVTMRLLGALVAPPEPAADRAVAVLAERSAALRAAGAALAALGAPETDWATARAALLGMAAGDAHRPREVPTAALLVVDDHELGERWQFDAGLALGGLGRAAIVVQAGTAPVPADLAALGVIALDDAVGLAGRLGAAGIPLAG